MWENVDSEDQIKARLYDAATTGSPQNSLQPVAHGESPLIIVHAADQLDTDRQPRTAVQARNIQAWTPQRRPHAVENRITRRAEAFGSLARSAWAEKHLQAIHGSIEINPCRCDYGKRVIIVVGGRSKPGIGPFKETIAQAIAVDREFMGGRT